MRRDSPNILSTVLFVVLLFVAASPNIIAEKTPSAKLSTKTFTASDGSFSVTYPGDLVHCEPANDGGTHSWVPAENCVAPIPVCDGDIGSGQVSLVCFAYPRNKITSTKAFGAATFSVELVAGAVTEKACLAGPSGAQPQPPATIHGVRFAVFNFQDAGMNKSIDADLYRIFHAGKCYQLGINVATTNAQVFDPPARELTQSDLAEVNHQLQKARESFRFLK